MHMTDKYFGTFFWGLKNDIFSLLYNIEYINILIYYEKCLFIYISISFFAQIIYRGEFIIMFSRGKRKVLEWVLVEK